MAEDTSLTTTSFIEGFLTWASGRGRILIVVHDNPDPDCMASALALRHLCVSKINREPDIAFAGIIARSENLAMAKELDIPLTPLNIVDLDSYHVICLLDTQPQTGNNSLPPDTRVDLVVDHHPLRPETRKCRWVDVRPDYGVTATILYEYLVTEAVHIGTVLATALFYAIKSETQDLGREAGRPDREAYLKLFPLSNKKVLYEITHPRLPIEYYRMVIKAIGNIRIYGNVLVSHLEAIVFPEMVAEMADFLVRMEDIDTAFCIGRYGNELILSIRTVLHTVNVGEIIRELVDGIGYAGGHGMMAGGKVDFSSPDEERRYHSLLVQRLLDRLQVPSSTPRCLFPE